MKKVTCLTPECSQSGHARGLCTSCYAKAWRSGSLPPPLQTDRHTLTEVDEVARRAICSQCGPVDFRPRVGRVHECMTVRRRQHTKRSKEARRRWKIKEKYGLTPDGLDELRRLQNGACAICSDVPDEPLHVDHDHSTSEVRGLLCRRCNLGLGFFKDDQILLDLAKLYLMEPPAQR